MWLTKNYMQTKRLIAIFKKSKMVGDGMVMSNRNNRGKSNKSLSKIFDNKHWYKILMIK